MPALRKIFFRLHLLVIFWASWSGNSYSIVQSNELDSLLQKSQNLPDGEEKATTLNRIAILYKHAGDSNGLIYARQALLLSQKLSYKKGIGDSFNQIGSFFKQAHRYPEALQYFDSALHHYKNISSVKNQGDVLNQKGIIYMALKDFRHSRECFQAALDLYEREKDSIQMANVLSNMGTIFDQQGMYAMSLEYYFKCLAIDERMNYQSGVASDYMAIALTFKKQGDFESALNYYQRSLEMYEKLRDEFNTASALTNMGIVYKDLGKLDQALEIQEKALTVFRHLNNPRGTVTTLHNIGIIYFNRNDLNQAMTYLDSAAKEAIPLRDKQIDLVNKMVIARIYLKQNLIEKGLINAQGAQHAAAELGLLDEQYQATVLLSEIYEKKGQMDLALEMTKAGIQLKDSLYNIEKARQIGELQTQYETTQKENQIKLLNNEKMLQESELMRKSLLQNVTWVGLGIFILVAFISFQAYRSKQEQRRLLLDEQLKNEKLEAGRLHELDEAKSRFFANIAHEFRTPLTLILGPSEQIVEETSDLRSKENANLIKHNADKLLALTNQLLDLSKLESGMIRLHASRNDFIAFSKGCVHSFNSLAEEKDIKLIFQAEHKSLDMDFDPEKVAVILNNLLSNALKFTEPFGEVNVAIGEMNDSSNEESVLIRINDTGIGIPAGQFPHIFDRFYQVDDSHTRKTQGTGIGLALVRELVELHGGTIQVASEPGKGTSFIITLPINQEQAATEEDKGITSALNVNSTIWVRDEIDSSELSKSIHANNQDRSTVQTLLVVEDNAEVRKFITNILLHHYHIIVAENGRRGLETAIEQMPDLIISDVMMPEMDGYEFCRQIREDDRTSHIPVIMLTAKAGMESKLEGLETGADDYLAKPFNSRELLARIRNLISLRQKLQKKFSQTQDASLFAKKENAFITRLKEVIEANIDKEEFNMDGLGRELAMSRTHVHRKLKAITNQSTSQFIRRYKLDKALNLLKAGEHNVSEVAYMVGFNSATYFSTCFMEQYGYPPSDLRVKS